MTPLTAEAAERASSAILQGATRIRIVLEGSVDKVVIAEPRLVWGQYVHEGPIAVVGQGIGHAGTRAPMCVPWSRVLTLHGVVD